MFFILYVLITVRIYKTILPFLNKYKPLPNFANVSSIIAKIKKFQILSVMRIFNSNV